MAETKEPPKLDSEPREAWSDAAQGWRVVEYRPGDVLAWTWDALAGEWETPDCDEELAILRAWALAERARAERAEQIAAAERRLRKAEVQVAVNFTDRDVCAYLALDDECQEARRAISALGFEP